MRAVLLRAALFGALVLPTTGCLVMPYHSPTEGAVADIRITNQSGRVVSISFYEDSGECRERHNVLPITQPGQSRDLKVDATKEATITLGQDVSIAYGCIGTFTFTPVDGHRYELNFRQNGGVCSSTFLDVTTSQPRKVDFQSRDWHTAFDEHGPFCKARQG